MPGYKHTSRLTVGVLAGWQVYVRTVPVSYLAPLLRGVRAAASERGCNLLIAGGIEPAPGQAGPRGPAWPIDSQAADFVPVGPWNTDGLIVVHPLIADERRCYVRQLRADAFPLVFVGTAEGGPAVGVDNAGGIRQALAHLVGHGHRRIAFIAGAPEDEQGDGGERLRAYLGGVRTCGLEADPRLVVRGHHYIEGGQQAVRQLLDAGVPFTAVLASNDESAIGAMWALKAAGLRVPQDVAVVGFDDRPEAMAQIPPLTTVHVSIFERGHRAVEMLLARLEGQAGEDDVICLPARLIVRASCGCGSPSAPAGQAQATLNGAARTAAASALAPAVTEAALARVRRLDPGEVSLLCQRLVEAFVSSLRQMDPVPFRQAVEDLLARVEKVGDDAHVWQAAISALRAQLGRAEKTPLAGQELRAAEDMLDEARIAISESVRRQYMQRGVDEAWFSGQVRVLNTRLLTGLDEEQIFDILAEHLPQVGIQHAVLAFFQAEEGDELAWSFLRSIPYRDDVPFRCPTRQFPPAGLYPAGEPFCLAVLPLHVQDTVRGFVAFDAARTFEPCAVITLQLAGALKTAWLYREAVEGRRLAEEANRLKSRFLSTVSHELRTPLSLIVGLSELLSRPEGVEGSLPEPYRRDAERIYASAQHLDGLIRDVLDLARSERGELHLAREPLDLVEALQATAAVGEQLARDKGLDWRVEMPPRLPLVYGDQARLRQVALNLLTNAVKFTETGGVALRLKAGRESVTLEVSDTGLGIAPEEQEAIFDEFRQSARTVGRGYGGLGLGLALARRLAELHGGRLGVRSSGQEGGGSTFYLMLPTLESQPARLEALPVADRIVLLGVDYLTKPLGTAELAHALMRQRLPPGKSAPAKTILLVDDEPAILDMHARIVQSQSPSYRVLKVRNGREALELMRRERPDLVLLDLVMPELDGFGVLEAMQGELTIRDIPVIVLTAQVLGEQDMARLRRGVAAVLGKGLFSPQETLARVEQALARSHQLGDETQRLVRKAMAFLHEHYAEPLSVEDLARHVGMNEDYLTRCFRREIGLTPVAYLNRYRVNRAKTLLAAGGKTVTEVAREVGFSNSGYFSQVFRREVGASPRQYQRGCKSLI
ncbi:MAG: substrate-binding domain-containing protein [Thermoflexales bacterium]|nr:substrate-binding domain-containing protein [Thermoflexales bacterium]